MTTMPGKRIKRGPEPEVPSDLRKGYQPRPLPPGVTLTPPATPAGDIPVNGAEGQAPSTEGPKAPKSK